MPKKQIQEFQIKRIEKIGSFIKNWRTNENYSQYLFSKMAEKHTNTISNIEAGKNITLVTLFDCLDAMGISASEFFEGVE